MFKLAIDGPAGAGKSTISKIVAKQLNFQYIDTGAMYRAITLKGLRLGVNLENEDEYDYLNNTVLSVDHDKIFIDGEDVSTEIRSVDVTVNVSTPSKIGRVRTWLVGFQRKISESKNVVMDGRDIGTVVLPNADLKIYLDASAECRARRRQLERLEKGLDISFEETLNEINVRDHKDSTRAISPLKVADDAIVIDSSDMTIDEVVEKIISLVNERGSKKMSNLKFFEGQEVSGVINNVTSDAIYLEVAGETKAVIYSNDLSGYIEGQKLRDLYAEGGDFKGLVKQLAKDKKTGAPLLILSTKLYHAREELKVFDAIKERDEIIKAKVVGVSRIGADLLYKSYNDIKVFLPIKNIDLSEKAIYQLKNEEIDVLITHVDHDRVSVTVSNTAAMNKINRQKKEAALAKLEVGQIHEGTVTNVLDFGAIVELGEVSGLLHRTELDHKLVKNVADFVKVGDVVKVKIIKMEEGKIGLSRKALIDHPWDLLKQQYHVGDEFEGTVAKVIEAGLLIKLTDEYSGLMPNSEYSWLINERIDGQYTEGSTIKVKITAIDDAKKRVSLSHRATKENKWANVSLRRGDAIKVVIATSEDRGAKVTYQEVTGFMPINEVTSAKRIAKVEEVFPIGTEVEVQVMDCDPLRARLTVSAKALEAAKERAEFDAYYKKQSAEIPTSTILDALGEDWKKFTE